MNAKRIRREEAEQRKKCTSEREVCVCVHTLHARLQKQMVELAPLTFTCEAVSYTHLPGKEGK